MPLRNTAGLDERAIAALYKLHSLDLVSSLLGISTHEHHYLNNTINEKILMFTSPYVVRLILPNWFPTW